MLEDELGVCCCRSTAASRAVPESWHRAAGAPERGTGSAGCWHHWHRWRGSWRMRHAAALAAALPSAESPPAPASFCRLLSVPARLATAVQGWTLLRWAPHNLLQTVPDTCYLQLPLSVHPTQKLKGTISVHELASSISLGGASTPNIAVFLPEYTHLVGGRGPGPG